MKDNNIDIIYTDKEHETYCHLIQDVLDELPYKVIKMLCSKVVFIMMGNNNYGQYHTDISKYVILMNPMTMERDILTPEEKRYVIAHEIAHFYKKHNVEDIDSEKDEKEADALAEIWGFPAEKEIK